MHARVGRARSRANFLSVHRRIDWTFGQKAELAPGRESQQFRPGARWASSAQDEWHWGRRGFRTSGPSTRFRRAERYPEPLRKRSTVKGLSHLRANKGGQTQRLEAARLTQKFARTNIEPVSPGGRCRRE